jgi:hypothetical protein
MKKGTFRIVDAKPTHLSVCCESRIGPLWARKSHPLIVKVLGIDGSAFDRSFELGGVLCSLDSRVVDHGAFIFAGRKNSDGQLTISMVNFSL